MNVRQYSHFIIPSVANKLKLGSFLLTSKASFKLFITNNCMDPNKQSSLPDVSKNYVYKIKKILLPFLQNPFQNISVVYIYPYTHFLLVHE